MQQQQHRTEEMNGKKVGTSSFKHIHTQIQTRIFRHNHDHNQSFLVVIGFFFSFSSRFFSNSGFFCEFWRITKLNWNCLSKLKTQQHTMDGNKCLKNWSEKSPKFFFLHTKIHTIFSSVINIHSFVRSFFYLLSFHNNILFRSYLIVCFFFFTLSSSSFFIQLYNNKKMSS